jgi:hypothetical protein
MDEMLGAEVRCNTLFEGGVKEGEMFGGMGGEIR